MDIPQIVRSNPKTMLSTVASLAAVVMLVYFVESRYASAADLTSFKDQLETSVDEEVRSGTKKLIEFQVQQLDDQIFQLQLREQFEGSTEMNKLMIKRYKSSKDNLNNQLRRY